MTVDHSLTYRKFHFNNILHRYRLFSIMRILDNFKLDSYSSYLDVGCSNGYLTDIISRKYNMSHVYGFDSDAKNIEIAQSRFPHFTFQTKNLNNKIDDFKLRFNLITCFETLEHVGNIENALYNLLSFRDNQQTKLFITVPIEIQFWGVLKFIIKNFQGYDFSELSSKTSKLRYFYNLLLSSNISQFRDNRLSWGTHYGFDYRIVDTHLRNLDITYMAKNIFTSRFYIIS